MNYSFLLDLLVLFCLGCLGWFVFSRLNIPVPALFGTIIITSAIKLAGFSLPQVPELLPIIQVLIGLYVGSKITSNSIKEIKTIIVPAIIIVIWALTIVFISGFILSYYTFLDPVTAIVSSSIGGLPEMTVIALETNADISVVIIMHTARIVITVLTFPIIIKYWMRNESQSRKSRKGLFVNHKNIIISEHRNNKQDKIKLKERCRRFVNRVSQDTDIVSIKRFIKNTIFSLMIATVGGLLFKTMGIPAGGMVGSMFFVAIFSLLNVMQIISPSAFVFGFMQIGLGLIVSENINIETVEVLMTGKLLIPIFVSILLILISSLSVSLIIHYVKGWDLPTCFLAAAPSGFTVMTMLAIKYDKDPLRVSMLHLCRLLAIKSVLPFVFMLYF